MILKLEKLIKTWTIQQLKVLTNPLTAKDMGRETKTGSNYFWKYILL